jgi:hypothetical protein
MIDMLEIILIWLKKIGKLFHLGDFFHKQKKNLILIEANMVKNIKKNGSV